MTEPILMPIPDEDDRATCPECHGAEVFACVDGCHERTCEYCDGRGTVARDELPG